MGSGERKDRPRRRQGMKEQGTKEWYQARVGLITASMFAVAAAISRSGKPTGTSDNYLYQKVGERLNGVPGDGFSSPETEHGIANEPIARSNYMDICTEPVKNAGFIVHPEYPDFGGSPDGLVGEEGGLEIKCPYHSRNHYRTFFTSKVPDVYMPQVQGLLWITGRRWWDFVSFDPRAPEQTQLKIIRVDRDEEYIDDMVDRLFDFRDKLLEITKAERIEKAYKEANPWVMQLTN